MSSVRSLLNSGVDVRFWPEADVSGHIRLGRAFTTAKRIPN